MKDKYKYLFGAILAGLILWFGRKRENEKYENQNAIKDKILHKQESGLEVYKAWIQLYQRNERIEDYLLANDCHSVAIYGLGRIGENLFEELSKSKITIDYVIDKSVSVSKGSYQSVLCYNPDAVLPKTDIIIITVPGEADEIAIHLADCGSPVVPIQDLLRHIVSG